MRFVFADTLYWYGLCNPHDQWHGPTVLARTRIGDDAGIVTTEEVLVEFLAAMSRGGEFLRQTGVALVEAILSDPATRVLPQSHSSFLRGLKLYSERPDKEYSMVDCISMSTMRDEGLIDVLSNDHHFAQEGFNVLIHR